VDTGWAAPDLSERIQAFTRGEDGHCYQWLGCHPAGDGGYTFRVWAPQAQSVSLVGDFCGWDADAQPMEPLSEGVWTCTLQGIEAYSAYGYRIMDKNGQAAVQTDPFATHRSETAAMVSGGVICREREPLSSACCPPNIYEVQLGAWRRYADGRVFSYDTLCEELIPYVTDMGFTHIRLLDFTHDTAPDPRHGTTEAFVALVDACHRAGIGVLLDWRPATDESPAAQSMALSRAYFWLEVWQVDGLWAQQPDPLWRSLAEDVYDKLFLTPSPGESLPPAGRSLLAGMPGDEDQAFAGVRTLLIYRLLSPIPRRLLMGDEIGQQRPWTADGSLDWLLMDYDNHRMLRHYVRTLNQLFRRTTALWSGAVWMPHHGVLVARLPEDVVAVCNTTLFTMEDIPIGIPDNGERRELFNTDLAEFGGENRRVPPLYPRLTPEGDYPYSISLTLPPLSTVLIRKKEDLTYVP